MKAIVVDRAGGEFRLAEVPTPKPGRHEVLVKIGAAAFNPFDVKLRTGRIDYEFPAILGCDFAGIVEQVGDLVREYQIGDRVFGFSFGSGSNGTYAEYVSVPDAFICKIPKRMSMEVAASLPVAYITAYRMLLGKGAFQPGVPLFVAGGGGGVSSAVIALAIAHGAGPIYTTAGSSESVAYLHKHFAIPENQIIRYRGKSVEEMVREVGIRFPLTLDCVGGEMKQLCIHLAAVSGHVGTILREEESFPISAWGDAPFFMQSLSLHQICMVSEAILDDPTLWLRYKAELREIAKLFAESKLPEPDVEVIGTFSPEVVLKGHQMLESGKTKGKIVFTL